MWWINSFFLMTQVKKKEQKGKLLSRASNPVPSDWEITTREILGEAIKDWISSSIPLLPQIIHGGKTCGVFPTGCESWQWRRKRNCWPAYITSSIGHLTHIATTNSCFLSWSHLSWVLAALGPDGQFPITQLLWKCNEIWSAALVMNTWARETSMQSYLWRAL